MAFVKEEPRLRRVAEEVMVYSLVKLLNEAGYLYVGVLHGQHIAISTDGGDTVEAETLLDCVLKAGEAGIRRKLEE